MVADSEYSFQNLKFKNRGMDGGLNACNFKNCLSISKCTTTTIMVETSRDLDRTTSAIEAFSPLRKCGYRNRFPPGILQASIEQLQALGCEHVHGAVG